MNEETTPMENRGKKRPAHRWYVVHPKTGEIVECAGAWPTKKDGYSVKLARRARIAHFDGNALRVFHEVVLSPPKDPTKDDAPLFYVDVPQEGAAWIRIGSVVASDRGFVIKLWESTAALRVFTSDDVYTFYAISMMARDPRE